MGDRRQRHGGNLPPVRVKPRVLPSPVMEKPLEYERFTLAWFMPYAFEMRDGKVFPKQHCRAWLLELCAIPDLAQELAHVAIFKVSAMSAQARIMLLRLVRERFSGDDEQTKKDAAEFDALVKKYVAELISKGPEETGDGDTCHL